MRITYYRYRKDVLRMRSRDMEYVVGLLKNSKDAGEILSVRHGRRICPENCRS